MIPEIVSDPYESYTIVPVVHSTVTASQLPPESSYA